MNNQNNKFCVHCGEQILAAAIICPKCGYEVDKLAKKLKSTTISLASKISLVLAIYGVAYFFFRILDIVAHIDYFKYSGYSIFSLFINTISSMLYILLIVSIGFVIALHEKSKNYNRLNNTAFILSLIAYFLSFINLFLLIVINIV